MAIDLQKQQVLESGAVVTRHHNSFLAGAGYE
jgi:hypothetical protein